MRTLENSSFFRTSVLASWIKAICSAGIAPAVSKGNETLLNAINDEIKALGKENFFHADYEATLVDTYGTDYEDSLVVEGGETSAQ